MIAGGPQKEGPHGLSAADPWGQVPQRHRPGISRGHLSLISHGWYRERYLTGQGRKVVFPEICAPSP